MKLLTIIREHILNEYSDKLINQMVALYQPQTKDTEDQIIANVKRFEQLTNSIAKKLADNNALMNAAIPDELKANNKFRDITQIKNYELLIKILKAADSKPVDIYKQAIDMYKKMDQYANPQLLGSYVARFKQNLDALVDKVKEKDDVALRLIPKELLNKEAYKNILNWRKFHDLEVMLDGVFPIENSGDGFGGTNDASTNADLIYENKKDGIEVYKGDEEHKCIQYGKGYGWCIGKGSYASYRYMQSNAESNRMFYFVFDRTQPKENKFHVCVIHVNAKGLYTRTSSRNDGDDPYGGVEWDGLGKYFTEDGGKLLWSKIKGLQKLFKFVPPNKGEQRRLGFRGIRKTLEEFIDMDPEDKLDWLRANATDRNIVNSEIAKALPADGEISRNELINYNRQFTFNELKDNKQLLRRYAEYRFSRYPDEMITPVFIPFFKDESKRRYYNKYKDKIITVEILDQFFGDEYVEEYLTKDAKKLWYIPEPYIERIPDQKLKTLYKTYYKLLQNWEYNVTTNNINKIMDVVEMNSGIKQDITPQPLIYNQWKEMDGDERRLIFILTKNIKYNGNVDDDTAVLYYGSPFIIDGKYVLLPTALKGDDDIYKKWVLSDVDGNVVKQFDGKGLTLGEDEIGENGYPSSENRRLFNMSELKSNGKPVKLNETIYDDWTRYQFMLRAGLIK